MQSLEQFYYDVVRSILLMDRYIAIQELEDVIVINFDCLYERNCTIRGSDQLIYLAHKMGNNKRFLFLSEDGAIVKQSGAVEIINNIVQCFNLNKDTCAIICREDLNLSNVTVINNEAVPYWCRVLYPYIKDIDIPHGSFSKKFACWFHRGTFYRLQLTKHLHDHYKDMSFISYQEQGMIVDRKLKEYFQDDIDWAVGQTPIIYDQLFPDRVFNFNLIVGRERKPYNEYFIEIVAETDILTTNWITEKTVKNLYIGKPFILMGGHNSLEKIRSFGFKTFSPWINETYDREPNIYLRLEAIKQEIDRLGRMNLTDLSKMYLEMMPIFQHNRTEYAKYINSR